MMADNYAWILHDRESAAVVDPGEGGPVLRYLQKEKLKLSTILVTHHHADHCAGVAQLLSQFRCSVIGALDSRMTFVNEPVSDGDELTVLAETVHCIATPGHTKTHMVYHLPALRALFTGDTLFAGGCGRLFEGTSEEMMQSLIKLAYMEDNTQVYCGHEYTEENLLFATTIDSENKAMWERLAEVKYMQRRGMPTIPSTISLERDTNPFLRAGDMAIRKKLGMENSSALDVFTEIRKRKDRF